MKKLLLLLILLISAAALSAQKQPKLVVGIVIDQMRMDYIYRYWDKFGEEGFKRMMSQGFVCKNAHFNYVPTYTGPGHASIYTGTTPMNHGIIANNWYDKQNDEMVYCTFDESRTPLGTTTEAGRMSPHQMLAPTLGDAVRIASLFKGKSIGVSIKDRGAILPAGHSANAAYWIDYESGAFVSSNYYMEELPGWVDKFNRKKHPDNLASEPWTPLLAAGQYTESTADDTPYEKVLKEDGKPVFPYDIAELIEQDNYYALARSPYGNTLLRMFAEQVIVEDDLGADEHCDLLAISFSSPDMIGHAFGPQSMEVEDTYLRLDAEIARLMKALDTRVGEDEYLLFLTADHAAAQVPSYLKDHNIPVNYFDMEGYQTGLTAYLKEELGEKDWIKNMSNQQIFIDHELLRENKLDVKRIFAAIKEFSLNFDGVAQVYDSKTLQHPLPDNHFASAAGKGWNQQRSGDCVIQFLPGWMEYGPQGTTHGSSYNYDTHVPLILFGKGVATGSTMEEVSITQIAPTISILSSIAFPMLSEHAVISGAIDKEE